tara:strand:+ start:133 stop:774 length:642 start_codon:yes stop_codon:yes gene_type:complete
MQFKKQIFNNLKNSIENQHKTSRLMVVSKNRPTVIINEIIKEGNILFGENKVQEAEAKFQEIRKLNKTIELHLIGPLQTNKVKQALKIFDIIQTIDREKLVNEISKELLKSKLLKKFYIQVNIGREDQKSGIDPERLIHLYDYSLSKGLDVVGLMCIPPNNKNPEIYFKKLVELRDSINPKLLLSMGMSADYREALKFKSDIIRIGSLLFQDD